MYRVMLTTWVQNPEKKNPIEKRLPREDNFVEIVADEYKIYKSKYIKFYNNDEEVACIRRKFVVGILEID